MAGGAAAFDYDNDGNLDIFFANSSGYHHAEERFAQIVIRSSQLIMADAIAIGFQKCSLLNRPRCVLDSRIPRIALPLAR